MQIRVPIKRRSLFQRVIRIPKMWYLLNGTLKGVPIFTRVSFLLSSAWIVLKPYKK